MDLRRLSDDDAAAVVNEYARINVRGGVDFYAREKFRHLTDDPREQFQMYPIEKFRKPMMRQSVHARIGEKNFKLVPRGGIVALRGGDIRPQILEPHTCFSLT